MVSPEMPLLGAGTGPLDEVQIAAIIARTTAAVYVAPLEDVDAGADGIGLLLPIHVPGNPILAHPVDVTFQIVIARLARDLPVELQRFGTVGIHDGPDKTSFLALWCQL